ncbi:hypothetical protein BUZ14_14070 [Staphylococcus gallinarum]|uniref:Uncharacterized protein n=2 Tax=Staphylococcus TaxID=1279 RepID=A0A3A0VD32_STAGA|nr:hypothetical protein BUZ76_05140 [Staphylococcus saprophyticus]PTK44131.1 hypothetical protein BUZ69_13095 [Staphylococcus saprophyticus]RIP29593.1 hypothetical protein BUZ14_14070 [Staphylococcus gallinarum]
MNLILLKKKPLGKPFEYLNESKISDNIINEGVAKSRKTRIKLFKFLLKSEVFGSVIKPGKECRATIAIQNMAIAYVISNFLFTSYSFLYC